MWEMKRLVEYGERVPRQKTITTPVLCVIVLKVNIEKIFVHGTPFAVASETLIINFT